MTIAITLFNNVRNPIGRRETVSSFRALVEALAPAALPPYAGEEHHPGWSAATFRDDYRRKDGIEQIPVYTAEHDTGTIPVGLALAILRARGLECAIMTTKSHTAERPRYRVLVALERPITSLAVREALFQSSTAWGLDLAPAESRDPARFWFLPSDGCEVHYLEGKPLPLPETEPPPPPSHRDGGGVEPYVRTALDRAQSAIMHAGPGERHSIATRESYSIGGLVGAGLLPPSLAESALLSAVQRDWPQDTQRETVRTIKGQLAEGAKKPRYVDPPERKSAAVPKIETVVTSESVNNGRPNIRLLADNADPVIEAVIGIKDKLLRGGNGSIRKVVANATTILSLDPRWQPILAYQALADRVVKLSPPTWHEAERPSANEAGPWVDADTTRLQAWLSREYGLDLGAEPVNAAVQAAAERRVIDPLRDYFDRIRGTWDGVKRVDLWLAAIFNAPNTEYSSAIGRRWLISCVARALRPGCKVDHVLILEGLQGKKKSTALEKLCPSPDLFFDSELAIGDKDAYQVLRGKWIIELGELAAISRHDLAILKAFITRKIDTYRPSFGRRSVDAPRRFVFSGSTNETEYLKDPTGNRRWWPVHCPGPIDIEGLEACRDQLWAEALFLFETGQPWWLETEYLTSLATVEQQEREQTDPWETMIASFLASALSKAGPPAPHGPACLCVRCEGITTGQLLTHALHIPIEKQDRAHESRAGITLRSLGWVKGPQRRRDGARVRPYFPPSP